MAYASTTSVPVEKSEAEIKALLRQRKADRIGTYEADGMAAITFEMNGRRLLFRIPLPKWDDPAFVYTPATRKRRTDNAQEAAFDQALRQRWRALLLCIKAKLESVDSGVESFEEAFLAQTVLPDGRTVAEATADPLRIAAESGKLPPLLLTFGDQS